MPTEPTREEMNFVDAFVERVAVAGFRMTIWKPAPHVTGYFDRWDVHIVYKANPVYCGSGCAPRLIDAIRQACERIAACVRLIIDTKLDANKKLRQSCLSLELESGRMLLANVTIIRK
jgi:hypothetical protein